MGNVCCSKNNLGSDDLIPLWHVIPFPKQVDDLSPLEAHDPEPSVTSVTKMKVTDYMQNSAWGPEGKASWDFWTDNSLAWFKTQKTNKAQPVQLSDDAVRILSQQNCDGKTMYGTKCRPVKITGHTHWADVKRLRLYDREQTSQMSQINYQVLFKMPKSFADSLPADVSDPPDWLPQETEMFKRLRKAFNDTKWGFVQSTGEEIDHKDLDVEKIKMVLNRKSFLQFLAKMSEFGSRARLVVCFHGTDGPQRGSILESNFSTNRIGSSSGNAG